MVPRPGNARRRRRRKRRRAVRPLLRVYVLVCLSVIARAFSRVGARVHDEHRLGCPGWTIRVHEERVAQASRFVVGHIC